MMVCVAALLEEGAFPADAGAGHQQLKNNTN